MGRGHPAPHLRNRQGRKESDLLGETCLPRQQRRGLSLSRGRENLRREERQALPCALHRERIYQGDDTPGIGRTHPHGIRQGEATPLRVLQPSGEARARRPDRPVDFGRYRVQLAATPPPVHVPAHGLLHRGACRRQQDGMVQRSGTHVPHQRHAGLYALSGQVVHRNQREDLQPYVFPADVPVVGQPGRGGQRPLPLGVPARRERRVRPWQA